MTAPGWGTVPYHRARARSWRRHLVVDGCIVTYWLIALALDPSVAWLRVLGLLLLSWQSFQAHRHLELWREHRGRAWQAEADGIIDGLHDRAGLFTVRDAVEALAELGPPPAGSRADRAVWRASIDGLRAHPELLESMRLGRE